jgi:omega-6 fatty acid desaturase (delta-12 desaturase)
VLKLTATLTIGWPLYLLFNVASRPYPGKGWVNHFDPWSPIFR